MSVSALQYCVVISVGILVPIQVLMIQISGYETVYDFFVCILVLLFKGVERFFESHPLRHW